MEQQIWSVFWALASLFLALAVIFFSKKKSRISNCSSSSQPETLGEQLSTPSSSSSQPETLGEQLSTPSSSDSAPPMQYEVFLSFKGSDVRTTFADHLYQFLDNYGIQTFLDNEELRKGEKCAPEILKAIDESKIFIPIFSSGYASSKWCLREVAHMLKCCKQEKRHIVLPIFYFMEPRDVRHQKGSYEEAFQRHNKVYGEEMIEEWRKALRDVGNIQGWEVNQSDRQGAVVREVFSRVRSHLMGDYLLVTEKLVSIDHHVGQVAELLNKGVKVVGIIGMGGIGKTTIAMAVRDEFYTKFDRCCFLRNVREALSEKEGIVALQKQIISAVVGYDENVQNASQGIRLIKDRVCRHKVLILIDDADERFTFEHIFGNIDDFSLESRFIITTRNQRVLEFSPHELYIPDELDHDDSLQLFSRHAFGLDYPTKDRLAISEEFVKVATGLPLALKVIGSTLNRRNERFWEEKLEQLKRIPHGEVQQRLMISFMDLTHEEQQIFLDIACIFVGESKEHPTYMWGACDFYPEIGIDALILKSLVKVNEKNEFWMHDSIRDLGRAIIREEDPQHPWRRSRIWSDEDGLEMLTNKEGTDRLEVLAVNCYDGRFQFKNKHFKKLSGLRYLRVKSGEFSGSFESVVPNINWLQLHDCTSIPIDLNVKKLVNFHLYDCTVTDDCRGWERIEVAHKLKSIHLSHCNYLETAPDLSQCGDLELLNIEHCTQMGGELHIGQLNNLKVLNLKVTKITVLTGDIRMLQHLKEMIAMNSEMRESSSTNIDSSLEFLEMLPKHLELKDVPLLPRSLRRLYLSSPSVPNLLDLKNLEELMFFHCDAAPIIPADIWKLSKLKFLKLSYSPCTSLLVKKEDGSGMGVVSSNSALPSSLEILQIVYCEPLKRLPSLSNLNNLTELIISGTSVCEISGLGELAMLKTFQLSSARNLATLDGLQHLMLLRTLGLERCLILEKLPSLSNLAKLQTLVITGCQLLSEIHGLGELGESLSCLEITSCPNLVYTECLGSLERSTMMKPLLPIISNLGKLSQLTLGLEETATVVHFLPQQQSFNLSGLHKLLELSISGSRWLAEVSGLERLELLESLCIENFMSLKKLNLSGLSNLKELSIKRCIQLTEVMGLETLESLQRLRIRDCTSIKKFPDLFLYKPFLA
ncbi:Disease resistance protein L6 [Linum perenne]